jgi:ankyrin repeat protein
MAPDPMHDEMSLHRACYRGRLDVVARLLGSGADPNARADSSETEWISCAGPTPRPLNCVAIAWTMTEAHVEIAKLLISHGAVVDATVLGDFALERASLDDPADVAFERVLEAGRLDVRTRGTWSSD